MNNDNSFKHTSLVVIWLWMLLFALLPFCLVIASSFLSHSENSFIQLPFTLKNYLQLNDAIYLRILKNLFLSLARQHLSVAGR